MHRYRKAQERLQAKAHVELVVCRLDVGPEAVRASAAVLSEDEHERADRLVAGHTRRRFTVAGARLRRVLGARLHVRPESVELVYGERGKPALGRSFADSGLRFNLSRAGDVAIYAFSTEAEIGVDVEAVRAIPDADGIATHAFSRRESVAYCALAERDKRLGFFNCWTRKEAFVKALGKGLSYPLDSFDVSLAPGEPARILRVEHTPGDRCGWALHSFVPTPGYVGAMVYGGGG